MKKQNIKRRFIVIAALAIVGLLLVNKFGSGRSEKRGAEYQTASVVYGDIEQSVLASGVLQAAQQVDVGAQVSGQIKSLKVALGDRVTKGQLIAEIDSAQQLNEIKNAEVALENLQSQRFAKEASLKKTMLAFKRAKTLLKADAVSRENFEEMEAALAAVKAEVATLNGQIKQAEVTAATAKLNLGYTKIVSPMDGVVVAIAAQEGQTVNAAQSTPTIVTVTQLDKMLVKARISEADIAKVKKGQEAYFSTLGNPEKKYPALLGAIEPIPENTKDNNQGAGAIYYNVMLAVENPDDSLRIGMTVQVSIVLAKAQHVLLIPASVLVTPEADGTYRLSILNGKNAEPRSVRVGINNNVNAEVVDGLTEGEKLVVGTFSLNPDSDI